MTDERQARIAEMDDAEERDILAEIAMRHRPESHGDTPCPSGGCCSCGAEGGCEAGLLLASLLKRERRIADLERERDEWARRAVGADHDRAGEYGERIAAEERAEAAERERDAVLALAGRLAEALREVEKRMLHEPECALEGEFLLSAVPRCDCYARTVRAALVEYDAAHGRSDAATEGER